MYNIQANESGTRSINVSDENLGTLRRFSLLQFLVEGYGAAHFRAERVCAFMDVPRAE